MQLKRWLFISTLCLRSVVSFPIQYTHPITIFDINHLNSDLYHCIASYTHLISTELPGTKLRSQKHMQYLFILLPKTLKRYVRRWNQDSLFVMLRDAVVYISKSPTHPQIQHPSLQNVHFLNTRVKHLLHREFTDRRSIYFLQNFQF